MFGAAIKYKMVHSLAVETMVNAPDGTNTTTVNNLTNPSFYSPVTRMSECTYKLSCYIYNRNMNSIANLFLTISALRVDIHKAVIITAFNP